MYDDVRGALMFLGYPRSGHSLVGALLDAHPQAVVAHEYDMLAHLDPSWERVDLFDALVAHARRFVDNGATWWGYDYAVDTGWQGGRWSELRIVGDKKGGDTTRQLLTRPEALLQLQAVLGDCPLHVVHVVRDPRDNIATLTTRQQSDGGVDLALEEYARLVSINRFARGFWPDHLWHQLHLDDLVAAPREVLSSLASRLGLAGDEDWLEACASRLFDRPRRTRGAVPWTSAQQDRLDALCSAVPFLHRYAPETVR